MDEAESATATTAAEPLTTERCFAKAAEALDDGQIEVAREWRELGQAVCVWKRRP